MNPPPRVQPSGNQPLGPARVWNSGGTPGWWGSPGPAVYILRQGRWRGQSRQDVCQGRAGVRRLFHRRGDAHRRGLRGRRPLDAARQQIHALYESLENTPQLLQRGRENRPDRQPPRVLRLDGRAETENPRASGADGRQSSGANGRQASGTNLCHPDSLRLKNSRFTRRQNNIFFFSA